MTIEELENFVINTYPGYFTVSSRGDNFSITLLPNIFPSYIYRMTEDTVIQSCYGCTYVSFNELINIEDLDSQTPYLTLYQSRRLELSTLNEYMVGIILDFFVAKVKNLQLTVKQHEIKNKLNKIGEDF